MNVGLQYSDVGLLRAACATAAEEFDRAYGARVETYRATVRAAVQQFTAQLQADVRRVTGGNSTCDRLTAQISGYLDWLQWTFWDLPHYALCLDLPPDALGAAVRTCGMAYLSLRIFDDVIDRHFLYKGRHATLLSDAASTSGTGQRAEGLTVLAGLLVCFDALGALARSDAGTHRLILERCLESLRRAVIGAVMEVSPQEEWSPEYYERMTTLKNVDFWRALYAGLDPQHASPLYPYLERYYLLAQKLNDVQDFAEDQKSGQPNLLSMMMDVDRDGRRTSGNGRIPPAAEAIIADGFLELGALASELSDPERLVAMAKLGESLEDAYRLGLFGPKSVAAPAMAAADGLGWQWYTTLEEVVAQRGTDALITVSCAICGEERRKFLFEKQGFAFHRCLECRHVYVSPQLAPELRTQLGRDLDATDYQSRLMEVQKFFAAPVCHLLRSRAPGPRLLDVGFGQGWILRLARSYGFEPYGIETSPRQMEALRPLLGAHLYAPEAGDFSIPWNGFDAVVISHVLEHLTDPSELLREVFRIMNPDGVLYVAVPDIESLQFRLFGKRWEVISPLTHVQYFSEPTMKRLLKDAYFVDAERVEHVPIGTTMAPRWMRLMRELGGNDSGEMAFACRRPALDAADSV